MSIDPYQELLNTLFKIKKGDLLARNKLLEEYKPFIFKTVYSFCHCSLEWGRSDELSIGMIAFNSAIDSFDPEKNASLLTYCRIVIVSRLKDYFRKEARQVNAFPLDDDEISGFLESKAAQDNYNQWTIQDERREELGRFVKTLSAYSISLQDLVKISPKHRDYRATLFKVAYSLSKDQNLMEYFLTKKQLPINELEKISGVKRKTLERGRKFIIASTLILADSNEFIYLRTYIDFDLK